jgi:hypothetical protein
MVKSRLHKIAKAIGIRRHDHETHPVTLRRLILLACLFSLSIVAVSSWLFYRDPRSKYDLVRPGRRTLPESFRADQSDLGKGETTKSDVKLELQKLQSQLNGLDLYGNYKDDALSDYKVLQGYLDQPITDQ